MAKKRNKGGERIKYFFNDQKQGETHGLMKEIFKGDGGEKTDMTRLERHKRNWKKITLIIFIIFLVLALGAALAGFFLFNKTDQFKEEGITFSYTGSTQAVSGEDLTLKIMSDNQEKVALTDATIEIQYPEGFTFSRSNMGPANQYNNQWQISTILPGDNETLEIVGQMIGEVGTSKKFSATLSYKPANFSSEFQKEISWEIVVASSTLELELKGSREVIPDQPTNYQLNYKNASTRDLQSLKITASWPEGFTLISSDPEIENTNWSIDHLPAGELGTIKFTGQFSGSAGASKELGFQLGLLQSDGSTKIQLDEVFIILLIEPQLQINLTLNNETEPVAVKWGDNLSYKVEFNNAGDIKLDQGKATLKFQTESEEIEVEADMVDWSTLINPQKAITEDNTLVWDSEAVEGLKTLKPGDQATLQAEISLVGQLPVELFGKKNIAWNATLDFSAERSGAEGGDAVSFSANSNTVSAFIYTQPDLSVEARYYNEAGEPIGLGPLPPVVGETTVFKVYWTITNGSNDLYNVSLSTTLPETASWIGQGNVSAGEPLKYNQTDRTITWSINKIPAYASDEIPALTAEFSVSITPTREQLNDYALLIDKAVLTGTDGFASKTIVLTRDAQSTSLTNDDYGRGKGKVIGQGD